MACSDYESYVTALEQAAFADATLCPFFDAFGGQSLFVGLLVIGAVNGSYYARQESVIMPVVTTILTAGISLQYVNGVLIQLIVIMLLLAFGTGPVLVIRRIGQ